MLLALIRSLGRSALRSKWAWRDLRMRAELMAELNITTKMANLPDPTTASDEVKRKLITTYREEPKPGYYVDKQLAIEARCLDNFVQSLSYAAFEQDPDYIGALVTDDGVISMYQIPDKPRPEPSYGTATYFEVPPAPSDPPGYTAVTRFTVDVNDDYTRLSM